MKTPPLFLFAVAPLALLLSCARQSTPVAGGGTHATVYLRDGNSFAGTVKSSTPDAITVAGDDGSTRTYPMTAVRSVDYGEVAPAPAPPDQTAGSQPPPPPAEPTSPSYHPPAAVVTTRTYDLPAGTQVSVRVDETIDSGRAAEGQTYACEVLRNVTDAARDIVIPRGANCRIVIRSASKGGRFRGASDLQLDLLSVSIDGRKYQLSTANLVEKGRAGIGKNKRTGEFAGGGAAVGAIIGAIAGHGKGAAIGAGSGAAAGLAAEVITKGDSIRIPAESVLTFRLDRPLHVTPAE